jgi:protein-tyrosine phosphatase
MLIHGSEPWFVDCHSHVIPSGDDGVETLDSGLALCTEAHRRGTRILFVTPHVSERFPLTLEREERFGAAISAARESLLLEVRIGFELRADRALLDEDPHRFALEGTDVVLIDALPNDNLDSLIAVGDHVEAAGLRPVIAHPERSWAIMRDSSAATPLLERNWLLQITGRTVAGMSDQVTTGNAWTLLAATPNTIVASDGHNAALPPFLDAAYVAARQRLGEAARSLFDGSRLLPRAA